MSYKLSHNNTDNFVIDFNDIYECVGFTQKGNAKRLLINKFVENFDYKLSLFPKEKRRSLHQRGGNNTEQILLTIQCFKKFCMKANTAESGKTYDYYIKME